MTTDDEDLLAELDLGGEAPPRRDTLERPTLAPAMPEGIYVSYERDLTEADLAAPRGPPAPPKSLARIHASHHSLARCLAAGMKHTQAALVTGYTAPRISQLLRDPAFQALVADYRDEVKSVFADLAARMNDMSLDAMELLQEQLQSKPESFTPGVLLDMIKVFADRTGHGPNQEVNLRVSTDLIDRPPRESFEDWETRRKAELGQTEATPPKALN